jgi:hypothetical protein
VLPNLWSLVRDTVIKRAIVVGLLAVIVCVIAFIAR